MTAKRTASEHARTGTLRPDRQRRLKAEAEGIGPAPAHLAEDVAQVWRELAAALPPGVARASDRLSFEMLARATAKMRAGGLTAAELAQVRQLADAFALSPRGRAQLDVMPSDTGSQHGDPFPF